MTLGCQDRMHAFLLLFAIATFVAPRCVGQDAIPPDLRLIFQEGVAAQGRGDFATAESKYRQVERQAPAFAPAVFNSGLVLGEEGNFAQALEAFERVYQIFPQYPNLHLFLGIEHVKLGQLQPAVESLTFAVKETPRDKQAWFWMARARFLLHQQEEALSAIQKAEEVAPGDASLEFLRATIYIEQQEWKRSEAILAELTTSHPGTPDIMNALGMVYYKEARTDLAIHEYGKVLQQRPDDPDAHAMMGTILAEQGLYRDALPHLLAAVEQMANVADLQVSVSEAMWHLGRQEEAIDHAQLAEQLVPGNAKSHFLLWKLYAETRKPSQAEEELRLFEKCTAR